MFFYYYAHGKKDGQQTGLPVPYCVKRDITEGFSNQAERSDVLVCIASQPSVEGMIWSKDCSISDKIDDGCEQLWDAEGVVHDGDGRVISPALRLHAYYVSSPTSPKRAAVRQRGHAMRIAFGMSHMPDLCWDCT